MKQQRIEKALSIDTYGANSYFTASSVFTLANLYAEAGATECSLAELTEGAAIFSMCGAAPGEMYAIWKLA